MATPSRYRKFLHIVERNGVWFDAIRLCLDVTYGARHKLRKCKYDFRSLHKLHNDEMVEGCEDIDCAHAETEEERAKREKAEDDFAEGGFQMLRSLELETMLPQLAEDMVAENWTVCELVDAFRHMHEGRDSLEDVYVAFKMIDLLPRSYGRLRRKLATYEAALFKNHGDGDHRPTLQCFFWLVFGGPVVQKDGRGGGITILSQIDKLDRLRREASNVAQEAHSKEQRLLKRQELAKSKNRFSSAIRRPNVVKYNAHTDIEDHARRIQAQEAKVLRNGRLVRHCESDYAAGNCHAHRPSWDAGRRAHLAQDNGDGERRVHGRQAAACGAPGGTPVSKKDLQLAADQKAAAERWRLAEERREGRRLEHETWVQAHPGQEADSPFCFGKGRGMIECRASLVMCAQCKKCSKIMTLSYNDRVVVHGLKSAAVQHLNGKTGTIVVVDTEAERYGIKIDGEEGPGVRCKMANLRVLEDPAPVPRNKRKEAAAAALRMAESFQRQMRLSTDQKQADECGCKALQLLERSRELFEEEEQTGDAKTYDRILEEARELEENDPCNTEVCALFRASGLRWCRLCGQHRLFLDDQKLCDIARRVGMAGQLCA